MQVPFVAMHMRGDPATMQLPTNTAYQNVVEDVAKELGHAAERALAAGIEPWCLILDPGVSHLGQVDPCAMLLLCVV